MVAQHSSGPMKPDGAASNGDASVSESTAAALDGLASLNWAILHGTDI